MASYREVVDEIEGALAHKRRRQFELGAKLLLCCEGSAPQLLDTAFSPPEPNRPGNLAFRSLLSSHRRHLHQLRATMRHMTVILRGARSWVCLCDGITSRPPSLRPMRRAARV